MTGMGKDEGIIFLDKVAKSPITVIPAQAGIQKYLKLLDAVSSPA